MAEEKQANLVVLRSPDGRGGWELVKPEDVPEWVKAPDCMAHLVRGETAMKCDEGEKGSDWFCARPAEEATRILNAQAKRARRAQARVARAHRELIRARHAVKH